jgi:hypothetical protein
VDANAVSRERFFAASKSSPFSEWRVFQPSAVTSQNAVSIALASASDAAQEIRDEVSATYGGALAEELLPKERGLVLWPGRWNSWNDGSIAAGIFRTMVENGSSGEADPRIVARLESRSESLVNRHWNTITALAKTLLEQEWAAPTNLHTGEIWTYEAKAKQINGNDVAAFLTQMGIPSQCDWMRPPR